MSSKIIVLFLLLVSVYAHAEDWKYRLTDALLERLDSKGNKIHSLDMQIIDDYINRISLHAKSYPPKFQDKNEQKEVVSKLKQLLGFLEITAENQQNNPGFLARAAFANSMGHNVDLKGTAEKARSYYKKLLKLTPDNPRANYQYGLFLTGTKKYHIEGIPFLEKALNLGQHDARYTLGLLYFERGEKEKAISMLEKYSVDHPENKYVKEIIETINSGKLKINSN